MEPVFANLRHNRRLTRFNLRGQAKVNAQWHLYCLLLRPDEVSSRIAHAAVLEVGDHALRRALQHVHVVIGGFA
jgi:hypothetical protein